jgi:plasmid stabilization system protein ParE
MGWKIVFAPQALEELEQIVRFIAQDDPQAAIRFGDYLVSNEREHMSQRGQRTSFKKARDAVESINLSRGLDAIHV